MHHKTQRWTVFRKFLNHTGSVTETACEEKAKKRLQINPTTKLLFKDNVVCCEAASAKVQIH